MNQQKPYIILLAVLIWPVCTWAQVSPSEVSSSQLLESCQAVLGTKDISWKKVALSTDQKEVLKPKLELSKNIPDTLHIGSVMKDGQQFWVVPNIAPSKSETFSYVLYLNAHKEIKDVDVLEYRESYGYEIDYPFFRKQFHNISNPQAIKFRRSIQNISGATISARSITYSVKDLLTIIQTVGVE